MTVEPRHELGALFRGHVAKQVFDRDEFYANCAQAPVGECLYPLFHRRAVVGTVNVQSVAFPVIYETSKRRGQDTKELLFTVTHITLKVLGYFPGEGMGQFSHRPLRATWRVRPPP